MKNLLTALFSLLVTLTFAQQTVTWTGGTPGNETNWNESRNWSTNSVPDENSNVLIKCDNTGHQAQPVINGEAKVASIRIDPGATLTVGKSGEVVIDGTYNYSEGITIYNGNLVNKGAIKMSNLDVDITENFLKSFDNSGFVFVDNKVPTSMAAMNFNRRH